MAAAYNRSAALFLLSVILFATANPLADALSINLASTTVTGRLCCTATGNCLLFSPPLVGATVLLNCTSVNGTSVTVGQANTTATGSFTISVTNLTNINALIPCRAGVNLPVNATICPQLSASTGVLQATVIPIFGVVLNIVGGVVNVLQVGVVGLFSIVTGLI